MGCIAGFCSAARRRCRPRPDVTCPRCSSLFTCNSILPVSPSRRRGCPTPSCTPASAHSSRRCKPGDALPTQRSARRSARPTSGVGAMIRLDLADIQGNIHRPYGRFGFPHTRHFFFNIADASAGRRFVQGVQAAHHHRRAVGQDRSRPMAPPSCANRPSRSTSASPIYGLRALGLPTRTLRLLPDEFIDGMGCRAEILGDVGGSFAGPLGSHLGLPSATTAPSRSTCGFRSASAPNPDGTPLPILAEWTGVAGRAW